jgi:dienelactone hydrolase
MHRRQLLGTALAFAAMQAMPRPRTFERLEACSPDTGLVNWTPDVLRPVSYGFKEYGPDVAPMRLRIFYPTYHFTKDYDAPLLKVCDVRWPLVLFLHGRPPCESDITGDPNYFFRWTRFATVLARSGYVVAIPSYVAPDPTDANHPTIGRATSVIDWVRGVQIPPDSLHPGAARSTPPESQDPGAASARTVGPLAPPRWENAEWVHGRATAIVGHSYGATLAARIASARSNISSFVSLSGVAHGATIPLIQSIRARKLFMWADNTDFQDEATSENLDALGLWGGIPRPKHAAFFRGGHFDYIRLRSSRECQWSRHPCSVVGDVAADLTALFVARHTPVGGSSGLPVSLVPPKVAHTPSQRLFANNWLSSFDRFESGTGCQMTVRWETPEGSSSRTLG